MIFCTIAFAGILSGANLLSYTVLGYLYKVAVEVVLLPATYAVIRAVRRHEPADGPAAAEFSTVVSGGW